MPPINNERNPKLIVKNGIYLVVRYLLVMFLAFYTTRLTLQVLGEVDYGINNIIGGIISMFAIVTMPITNSLQRFFNVEYARKIILPEVVFNTSLKIIAGVVILMLLLYESVGLYLVEYVIQYPESRHNAVLIIFQLTALMTLFSFAYIPYTALLFAKEDMGVPAMVELLASIYKLAFLIAIPFINSDSLVLFCLFLLSTNVLQFIFYFFYCKSKYPETNLSKAYDNSLGRQILSFSGWNTIEAIAGLSITYLTNIIINIFGGVLYNTAYGLSKSLNTSILSFTTNIIKAVEPQITSSTVLNDDSYRNRLVLTTIKLSMLGVGFISVLFYFDGMKFLSLWLGTVPNYTFEFCFLMLISSLFSSVILPLRSLIIATGRIQWYFSLYGLFSLVAIVVMYGMLKLGYPIITAIIVSTLFNVVVFMQAIVITCRVTTFTFWPIIKSVVVSLIPLGAAVIGYSIITTHLGIQGWGGLVLSISLSLSLLIFSAFYIVLSTEERNAVYKAKNKVKLLFTKKK